MVQNREKHRINSHPIIHCPTREGVSEGVSKASVRAKQASERVSAAERASKASRVEQANKWAVWAKERKNEQVAQYFSRYSWSFWTIVRMQEMSPKERKSLKFILNECHPMPKLKREAERWWASIWAELTTSPTFCAYRAFKSFNSHLLWIKVINDSFFWNDYIRLSFSNKLPSTHD